jgi:hypothetical protein
MEKINKLNFIISTSDECKRNEQYGFFNNDDDIVNRKINMLKILKLMTVTELDSIISEIISENEDTIFNYFNLLTSRIIINKITDMKIIPIEMIDDNYYHFNL